jgi:imidazolonepropionase-like amidohydrolase
VPHPRWLQRGGIDGRRTTASDGATGGRRDYAGADGRETHIVAAADEDIRLRFISGADAGIAPGKAHGGYAEAVIELSQVTGTVPALVAASSNAAAAIGLGRSKGRLRRAYDADVLVVSGDRAADLPSIKRDKVYR